MNQIKLRTSEYLFRDVLIKKHLVNEIKDLMRFSF